MKKSLLTILLISFATLTFAQKVKIENEIAYVDGKEYLRILDGCNGFDGTCSLGLLNGKEIIYMDYRKVTNPSASGYNYWHIKFLDYEQVAEIQNPIKDIVRILYNSEFLTPEGNVNESAVKRICSKYDKKYSWF